MSSHGGAHPGPCAGRRSPGAGVGAGGGRSQRGLGLPELLVGLAVGAIVLVGGIALLERQVAGHRVLQGQWQAEREWQAVDRLMQSLLRQARVDLGPEGLVLHDGGRRIEWQVEPGTGGPARRLGWRVQAGVLQLRIGEGGWQPQTDPSVLQVLELTFEWPPQAPGACGPSRLRWQVTWRHGPASGRPTSPTRVQREVALRQAPWGGAPCPA